MLNIICAAIGKSWSLPFEDKFIIWLQSLAGSGSVLYYLMNFISMFGEETLLIAVVGLLYWGIDKKRGERVGISMLGATLLNPMIKNIVCRTRPFDSNLEIENFRDVDGYSFPSGHSSGSASAYFGTAYAFRDKKKTWLWVVGIALPLLVALSRNYLGAHYPTDVICGLLLGVGLVLLFNKLLDTLKNKYYLYIALCIIGFAGFFYCTTNDYFTGYGIIVGFTFGIYFEEKVTKFENTNKWWRVIIRTLIGGGLYLGLNALLKAIFGPIFTGVWAEHIFRVVRYAVLVFLLIGVYPMLFKVGDKVFKKFGWIK